MGPRECPATCFLDDHRQCCLPLSWQELGFANWRCRCAQSVQYRFQALALCKGEVEGYDELGKCLSNSSALGSGRRAFVDLRVARDSKVSLRASMVPSVCVAVEGCKKAAKHEVDLLRSFYHHVTACHRAFQSCPPSQTLGDLMLADAYH